MKIKNTKTRAMRAVLYVVLAVLALAGLIGGFTLYPPQGLLFRDLSAVGSWLPLPC